MYNKCFWIFIFCIGCSGISENAQNKYKQAISSWNAGNHTKPIVLLEEVVVESPKFFDAHIKLAEYNLYNNNPDSAIKSIAKAKALDNTKPVVHILTGNAYIQQTEYLKSQGEYNKALELETSNEQKFEIFMGKGLAKINLGLYEDAQEYIDKAKKIDPSHLDIIFLNALLREKKMGPNSVSMKEYKQTLDKKPKHLLALKAMGDTWRQLDQSQKAIDYYQRFMENGGKSKEINKYLDEQIAKRKQKLAVQQKIVDDTERARIELEKVKTELEKAKIQAQTEAQKVFAEAEIKKAEAKIAEAEASAKKAEAEASIKKVEAETHRYLNDPLLKEALDEAPLILTCPQCGRIYKESKQKTCDYDGTPLAEDIFSD